MTACRCSFCADSPGPANPNPLFCMYVLHQKKVPFQKAALWVVSSAPQSAPRLGGVRNAPLGGPLQPACQSSPGKTTSPLTGQPSPVAEEKGGEREGWIFVNGQKLWYPSCSRPQGLCSPGHTPPLPPRKGWESGVPAGKCMSLLGRQCPEGPGMFCPRMFCQCPPPPTLAPSPYDLRAPAHHCPSK